MNSPITDRGKNGFPRGPNDSEEMKTISEIEMQATAASDLATPTFAELKKNFQRVEEGDDELSDTTIITKRLPPKARSIAVPNTFIEQLPELSEEEIGIKYFNYSKERAAVREAFKNVNEPIALQELLDKVTTLVRTNEELQYYLRSDDGELPLAFIHQDKQEFSEMIQNLIQRQLPLTYDGRVQFEEEKASSTRYPSDEVPRTTISDEEAARIANASPDESSLIDWEGDINISQGRAVDKDESVTRLVNRFENERTSAVAISTLHIDVANEMEESVPGMLDEHRVITRMDHGNFTSPPSADLERESVIPQTNSMDATSITTDQSLSSFASTIERGTETPLAQVVSNIETVQDDISHLFASRISSLNLDETEMDQLSEFLLQNLQKIEKKDSKKFLKIIAHPNLFEEETIKEVERYFLNLLEKENKTDEELEQIRYGLNLLFEALKQKNEEMRQLTPAALVEEAAASIPQSPKDAISSNTSVASTEDSAGLSPSPARVSDSVEDEDNLPLPPEIFGAQVDVSQQTQESYERYEEDAVVQTQVLDATVVQPTASPAAVVEQAAAPQVAEQSRIAQFNAEAQALQTELEKNAQEDILSSQTLLSNLLNKLQGRPGVIINPITSKLDNTVEAFSFPDDPQKVCFRVKATYTLKVIIEGEEKEFKMERVILTNATNPAKAVLIANRFKNTVVELAESKADRAFITQARDQRSFIFECQYNQSTGRIENVIGVKFDRKQIGGNGYNSYRYQPTTTQTLYDFKTQAIKPNSNGRINQSQKAHQRLILEEEVLGNMNIDYSAVIKGDALDSYVKSLQEQVAKKEKEFDKTYDKFMKKTGYFASGPLKRGEKISPELETLLASDHVYQLCIAGEEASANDIKKSSLALQAFYKLQQESMNANQNADIEIALRKAENEVKKELNFVNNHFTHLHQLQRELQTIQMEAECLQRTVVSSLEREKALTFEETLNGIQKSIDSKEAIRKERIEKLDAIFAQFGESQLAQATDTAIESPNSMPQG